MPFISKKLAKFIPWFKQHIWECLLAGAVLLSFGLFLITFDDYGASYDEPLFYEYADRMVDAYKKMAFGENIDSLLDFYDLPFYGPAYLIIGRLAIGGIRLVFPGLEIYNAWHTVNFATFPAWRHTGLLADSQNCVKAGLVYCRVFVSYATPAMGSRRNESERWAVHDGFFSSNGDRVENGGCFQPPRNGSTNAG